MSNADHRVRGQNGLLYKVPLRFRRSSFRNAPIRHSWCLVRVFTLGLFRWLHGHARFHLPLPTYRILGVFHGIVHPSMGPPIKVRIYPIHRTCLLGNHFVGTTLARRLFLHFFPSAPFPILPSIIMYRSCFLRSRLVRETRGDPLVFPGRGAEKLGTLGFGFLLSFLILLKF